MSEHTNHELPGGVKENQLRYVIPGLMFEQQAIANGWAVHIENGTAENDYMVRYGMARQMPDSFDDTNLADLKEDLEIVRKTGKKKGMMFSGYDAWIESVKTWPDGVDRAATTPTSNSTYLCFEFEGFPTKKTMDVLDDLVEYQPPAERPGLWYRALGYFGLYKLNSHD